MINLTIKGTERDAFEQFKQRCLAPIYTEQHRSGGGVSFVQAKIIQYKENEAKVATWFGETADGNGKPPFAPGTLLLYSQDTIAKEA